MRRGKSARTDEIEVPNRQGMKDIKGTGYNYFEIIEKLNKENEV